MSRPSRPSFIRTKGDRRKLGRRIDTTNLEMYYRDLLRGKFIYKGLPPDCPTGFIEADALWDYCGCSMKKVRGYKPLCVFPCSPVYLDIYGRPTKWLPNVYGWAIDGQDATPDGTDIFSESDSPVLWNTISYRDRVLPFLQIQARALTALGNNISSLNHAVIISGVAGNAGDNVGAMMLESELQEGATYIPVCDVRGGNPLGIQAVDLKVNDHTANLVSVIENMDSTIKMILGVDTGVQKSSGIGAFDAKGITPIAADTDAELSMRQDWLEKLNAIYGTDMSVERNDSLDKMIQFSGVTMGASVDTKDFEDS